jgi:hypothetical protein
MDPKAAAALAMSFSKILFGQNQFSVLGFAQAVGFAAVLDEHGLLTLEQVFAISDFWPRKLGPSFLFLGLRRRAEFFWVHQLAFSYDFEMQIQNIRSTTNLSSITFVLSLIGP